MEKNLIGTAPFQGKARQIYAKDQWSNFRFDGQNFYVGEKTSKDFKKVNELYEKYCEIELKKIIQRQINQLKSKEVKIPMNYTQGQKSFKKITKVSVASYLKLMNFSEKLDFKIGNYTNEWGINQIDSKKRAFTLLFNVNLIKYDSDIRIKHVVAHELAHVFFRDHGTDFQNALAQLDPNKSSSENFFKNTISKFFRKKAKS